MKKVCFKILSVFVVLIILGSCFSGCSKKDSVSSVSDTVSVNDVNPVTKEEGNSSMSEEKYEDKDNTVANNESKSSNVSQSNSSDKTVSTQNKQEDKTSSGTSPSTTSSKTPATAQKISIDKQRLYNHMISVYEEPPLSLITKMSKSEFIRKTNGNIPSKYQSVFNWMFAIADGNGPEEMPALSVDETWEVGDIMDAVLNYRVPLARTQNSNRDWVLYIDKNQLKTVIDNAYNSYSNTIDDQNQIAQAEYNKNLEIYKEEIKYVGEMCNLIESIGQKIGLNMQTQSEAVDLIVKYICDNCDYNFAYVGLTGKDGRTVGSCLKDNSAICVGYAKGFYALCYYAGINVSYYAGTIPDGSHAWNSITIDGKKYFFDVTNQDGVLKIDKNATDYVWCTSDDFKTYIQKENKIYFW